MRRSIVLVSTAALGSLFVLAMSCSVETNPNPGTTTSSSGGSSSGGSSTSSSGAASSSGGSSSGGSSSGGSSSGGSSSGGSSSGSTSSGGDSGTDSGGGDNLEAKCSAYCTCMSTRCVGINVGGTNNCGTECMANGGAKWDLACRTTHCGYSPPAPEPVDTLHCGHAIGTQGACADN